LLNKYILLHVSMYHLLLLEAAEIYDRMYESTI
jgi:hypothetical protein